LPERGIDIMATEAAKARNTAYKNKWISENKERVNLVVERGRKTELQAHAEAHNESLNGFITRAIDNQVERDIAEQKA
jgi:uncharacterized protein (DUF1778 family)